MNRITLFFGNDAKSGAFCIITIFLPLGRNAYKYLEVDARHWA